MPTLTLALLAVIAWGVWEAVHALRHLSVQQAAVARVLVDMRDEAYSPSDYAQAIGKELEARQERARRELEDTSWRP